MKTVMIVMGVGRDLDYVYSDPDVVERVFDLVIIFFSVIMGYFLTMKLIMDAYISACSLLPITYRYIPIHIVEKTVLGKAPQLVYLVFQHNLLEYLYPFILIAIISPIIRTAKINTMRPYIDVRSRLEPYRIVFYTLVIAIISEVPLLAGILVTPFYYYVQGSLYPQSIRVVEIELLASLLAGVISTTLIIMFRRVELGVMIPLVIFYVLIQLLWRRLVLFSEVVAGITVFLLVLLFVVERWRLVRIA